MANAPSDSGFGDPPQLPGASSPTQPSTVRSSISAIPTVKTRFVSRLQGLTAILQAGQSVLPVTTRADETPLLLEDS